MKLVEERYFYEETPYCSFEEDVLAMKNALDELKYLGAPSERSRAFYGSMMSLVFT